MTEIRIQTNVPGKASSTGAPAGGDHWHPDSPRNRQMLRVILESCIEIYGVGTHWVEVREIVSDARLESWQQSKIFCSQKGKQMVSRLTTNTPTKGLT